MVPEPIKVMIDTNVLISGALNPNGFVAKSLYKAMMSPFEPVVCDYIIDEVHRKFQQKFPDIGVSNLSWETFSKLWGFTTLS